MLIELSDRTRDLLVQSLPLMEHRKDALIEGLARYLRGGGADASQNSDVFAIVLTDLLIAKAEHLVRSSALLDLDEICLEHSRLRLPGRYYSRFGDALAPVIRDVLGPKLSRETAGAWGDVFWAIIHAVQANEAGPGAALGRASTNALPDALHPIWKRKYFGHKS
jgi:hemoglobin-like flavoprotein